MNAPHRSLLYTKHYHTTSLPCSGEEPHLLLLAQEKERSRMMNNNNNNSGGGDSNSNSLSSSPYTLYDQPVSVFCWYCIMLGNILSIAGECVY